METQVTVGSSSSALQHPKIPLFTGVVELVHNPVVASDVVFIMHSAAWGRCLNFFQMRRPASSASSSCNELHLCCSCCDAQMWACSNASQLFRTMNSNDHSHNSNWVRK